MGAFETASCAKLLIPRDFEPGALLSALSDGFAEDELVVTGGESRERSRRFEIAGVEICVIVLEKLDERVGVAFRVSAGIRGVATGFGAEQRRIFDERLVCFFAAANPERVESERERWRSRRWRSGLRHRRRYRLWRTIRRGRAVSGVCDESWRGRR